MPLLWLLSRPIFKSTNIHHIKYIYLIGEMLVYHFRRWHNIKPVLAERLVFVGHYVTDRAPGEGMGYG